MGLLAFALVIAEVPLIGWWRECGFVVELVHRHYFVTGCACASKLADSSEVSYCSLFSRFIYIF